MEKGSNNKIEKLDEGRPLQRFKNQNLLLKKFGEVGLQVYRVITGKRTTEELRSDLDMDEDLFTQIINYMEEAGMVKLSSIGAEPKEAPVPEEAPEVEEAPVAEELPVEEEVAEEELAPELEEEPATEPEEDIFPEEEIKPEEEILPEKELAPELEKEKEEIEKEEEEEKAPEIEEFEIEEEIEPEEILPEEEISIEEEEPSEEKEEKEPFPEEEELFPEEKEEELEPEEKEEEFEPEEIEFGGLEEEPPEDEGVSPVEKIIRNKYGDIGVQVYTLIDGQRTAEEIMGETGLDEAKLVEILDFLDEQGIIKLEYPKGKADTEAAEVVPKEVPAEEFSPMIEEEAFEKGMVRGLSPDIIPTKASVSIVKSVQLRAKTMLRFGDVGDKLLAALDGKADIIALSLKLNIPLYKLMDILNFLKTEGGTVLNPVPRTEIRRRYGDDGYAVYKKYGKEGLMLYELIGKDLTIKQMADKITQNKQQVYDMFLFIYEVLGIEMPINKEALKKELGL